MYLMLENDGEVEHRAFMLLGASVKDTSLPIGMFGSGTKYAISKLLRDGVSLRIFSGAEEIVLRTIPTIFRSEKFNLLTVNGEATSITTETGKDWTIIQSVREFWSNALDEPGALACAWKEPEGRPGKTRVFIELTLEVQSMWDNWAHYFAPHGVPLIAKCDEGRIIHPKYTGGRATVYRRGIWCVEDNRVPFLYSYDMRDVKLTEARVRSSDSFTYVIDDALKHLDDEGAIFDLLCAFRNNPGIYAEENACTYLYPVDMQSWRDAFARVWEFWCSSAAELEFFPYALRPKVYVATSPLAKLFEHLGLKSVHDYIGSGIVHKVLPMGARRANQLDYAIRRLEANNIRIEWPCDYVEFKDETIAYADCKRGRILLSTKAFESEDMLLKALIEEYTHLEHDVRDGTVDQQHAYLNIIVSLLRSIA